jgi:polysaccharide biosynthesis/export protein
MSSSDRADLEAASAAAETLGEDDWSHFTAAGDPLLRTGLLLGFSLRVGERIEVEPMRMQIMDKGELTFPMIGTVACDGLTLQQLKRVLEERYGTFFRDPAIFLEFHYEPNSVSPWGRVLVQGRVAGEGWVNIPPTRDLTVSRAIQVAGGYASSAKKSAIIVTRRKSGGDKEVLRVNLERVGRKGEIERDIRLLPGDVVYVPESVY